jgi:hypothetical protein
MTDSEQTVSSFAALTRSILGSLSHATEALYDMPVETDEERAIKSWTIYCCVMICDYADSALTCYLANQVRAMTGVA